MIIYFGLMFFINCSSLDRRNDFDEDILKRIGTLNYYNKSLSYNDFQNLKDSILRQQPLKKPFLKEIDEYSLTGYVNALLPDTDDLFDKYARLNDRSKLQFIQNIISTNVSYFRSNNAFFTKALNSIKEIRERDTTLFALIKLYTEKNSLKFDDYIKILNKIEKFNYPEQSFLAMLITVERESEFAYKLLVYLSTRNDWSEIKGYIRYWPLYETKDKTLNSGYKQFFKTQLLTKGYQENPWNGYNSFLPKWFTSQEIIEICEYKKRENETYNFTFFNEIRNVSSIELYVSNASFYQAKYFPIDSTISIIENIPIIDQKLSLSLVLLNVRTDITETQKKRIKAHIYEYKNQIFDSNPTSLLILVLRSIEQNFDFNQLLSDFPNLYKDWYPDNYLQNLYNTSKYGWLDYIHKANELSTFDKPLSNVNDYYIAEYMTGNYAFRLNNSIVLEAIFETNNINVSLNAEYGDWPIDYSYIIKNSFQNIFANKLNEQIDNFYSYKSLTENSTEYKIYVWYRNKINSICFIDTTGMPNNEALLLLYNKILIDTESNKRFVKYTTDEYKLVLVEPSKLKHLMTKMK